MTTVTPDVQVDRVRWPSDGFGRDRAAALGNACLLLVEEGSPPEVDADREDWVRLPAPPEDIDARAELLAGRWVRRDRPVVGPDGVLRFGAARVPLPEGEQRLAEVLVECFGRVVPRTDLRRAGWGGETCSRNALDVRMGRLRRRVGEVGLRVRTVRGRGYLLEPEV